MIHATMMSTTTDGVVNMSPERTGVIEVELAEMGALDDPNDANRRAALAPWAWSVRCECEL